MPCFARNAAASPPITSAAFTAGEATLIFSAGMPFSTSSSFSYEVLVRIASAGSSRLRSLALRNCSFSSARYGSPAFSIGWATYGTPCFRQYAAAAAISGACGNTPACTRSNRSEVCPSHHVNPGTSRCGRSKYGCSVGISRDNRGRMRC